MGDEDALTQRAVLSIFWSAFRRLFLLHPPRFFWLVIYSGSASTASSHKTLSAGSLAGNYLYSFFF